LLYNIKVIIFCKLDDKASKTGSKTSEKTVYELFDEQQEVVDDRLERQQ